MENKRLKKQIHSNSTEEALGKVAGGQPKVAGKPVNRQRRGSRLSFKSISSVPALINIRSRSNKSLNTRRNGKKDERRRVTMNHITSSVPPSGSDDVNKEEGRRVTLNHVKSPAQTDASTTKRNAKKAGSKRRVTIKQCSFVHKRVYVCSFHNICSSEESIFKFPNYHKQQRPPE